MKYCSSSYQNLLSIFWRLLFLCWSVLIDNSSKNIFSPRIICSYYALSITLQGLPIPRPRAVALIDSFYP